MKAKNGTVRTALIGGLMGLMTATSGGCAGMQAPLRTYISSTSAQRHVLQEQDVAAQTLRKGRVQEGHVLYVPMQDAGKVLANEFGVDIEERGYPWLYEGNAIEVSYRKDGEIVRDTQKIAADCTIDTLDFGKFDACVTRSQLDEAITKEANSNGIASVSVRQIDHPMAELTEAFTGKAFYLGEANGQLVSGSIPFPAGCKAHRFLLDSGIGHDANYVSVVMKVPANDAGIDRVVAVAPMYDLLSGRTTMPMGHDDVLIASGTNYWRDLRANLQEIGGLGNDLTGASDAGQKLLNSLDRYHTRSYLESNAVPKETGLQKAGRVLGEINKVRGEATTLTGGCPGAK